MQHLNAGGTEGGAGRFLLGLAMLVVGLYLFFDAVHVANRFTMRMSLYNIGGVPLRSGMVLIPFIFGVGLIFYDARRWLGWALACGALAAFGYGVVASTQFRLQQMSAFDLIVILVLSVGGLGLFLSSLRTYMPKEAAPSAPAPAARPERKEEAGEPAGS